MKILYARVSSISQNLDRQIINEENYDYVVTDTCSGAIAFFDRQGGKEIKSLIDRGVKNISIHTSTVDRLGRSLKDILNTLDYLHSHRIPVHLMAQGITTLDPSGKENPIAKLILSILGTVAEMERSQIRERQLEGIKIAKAQKRFLGRKEGTKEDTLKFLSKLKNQKALEYLKKGYTSTEISKIVGININTITKIKKLGLKATT